jgi:hypothetical protein
VPDERLSAFAGSLENLGISGAVIGEVVEGEGIRVAP